MSFLKFKSSASVRYEAGAKFSMLYELSHASHAEPGPRASKLRCGIVWPNNFGR